MLVMMGHQSMQGFRCFHGPFQGKIKTRTDTEDIYSFGGFLNIIFADRIPYILIVHLCNEETTGNPETEQGLILNI